MVTPTPASILPKTTVSPRKTKLTFFTFGFVTAFIMAAGMFAAAYSLTKNALPQPELPSSATTQTTPPQNTPVETTDLVISPTEIQTQTNPLRQLSITYSLNPDWATYTDSVAGFSVQYDASPDPAHFNSHYTLGANTAGKSVIFNTCNTPPTGPNAGQEVCLKAYSLTVYANYAGGSRREWFTQNLTSYPNCQVYYADLALADQNSLVATSNCSSWGETYVLIPHGSNMLVLTTQNYSRNDTTGAVSLSDSLKDTLSTFRLLN